MGKDCSFCFECQVTMLNAFSASSASSRESGWWAKPWLLRCHCNAINGPCPDFMPHIFLRWNERLKCCNNCHVTNIFNSDANGSSSLWQILNFEKKCHELLMLPVNLFAERSLERTSNSWDFSDGDNYCQMSNSCCHFILYPLNLCLRIRDCFYLLISCLKYGKL